VFVQAFFILKEKKKMGKKKTVQENTQTNTFGYVPAQVTKEMQAVIDMKAQKDPTIPYRSAAQREDLANSYSNPLGSYTTPAVREAVNRSAGQRLAMDEAQANAESQFNVDNENYNRAVTGANLSAPRFVQTGGSSTGTTTQSGGFLGDLALGLAGSAGSYATGGMSRAASSKLGKAKSGSINYAPSHGS
jgi:hypothetical protein